MRPFDAVIVAADSSIGPTVDSWSLIDPSSSTVYVAMIFCFAGGFWVITSSSNPFFPYVT